MDTLLNNNKIIINRINTLPNEIKNLIYSYFWSHYYNKFVIKDLIQIKSDLINANKYITIHGINNTIVDLTSHYHYYELHNETIKKIHSNFAYTTYIKSTDEFCHYYPLFNFLINSRQLIEVKDKYRYYCTFLLCTVLNPIYREYDQFKILNYFKNLV
tara:strand:+ start:8219 stop:8692 length:474 start_codon:yes stop_codon:yes gene_type:complete